MVLDREYHRFSTKTKHKTQTPPKQLLTDHMNIFRSFKEHPYSGEAVFSKYSPTKVPSHSHAPTLLLPADRNPTPGSDYQQDHPASLRRLFTVQVFTLPQWLSFPSPHHQMIIFTKQYTRCLWQQRRLLEQQPGFGMGFNFLPAKGHR